MKKTAIKIGEDLLMRINRLKYQWGYKTQEQVLRRLIELKTPPITTAKSHQNSSTPTLFTNSYNSSSGGADNTQDPSDMYVEPDEPDPLEVKEEKEE